MSIQDGMDMGSTYNKVNLKEGEFSDYAIIDGARGCLYFTDLDNGRIRIEASLVDPQSSTNIIVIAEMSNEEYRNFYNGIDIFTSSSNIEMLLCSHRIEG